MPASTATTDSAAYASAIASCVVNWPSGHAKASAARTAMAGHAGSRFPPGAGATHRAAATRAAAAVVTATCQSDTPWYEETTARSIDAQHAAAIQPAAARRVKARVATRAA